MSISKEITGKCKPKSYTTLQVMNWKFVIALKPQQRWDYRITTEGRYHVERDILSINLEADEFHKMFREKEDTA